MADKVGKQRTSRQEQEPRIYPSPAPQPAPDPHPRQPERLLGRGEEEAPIYERRVEGVKVGPAPEPRPAPALTLTPGPSPGDLRSLGRGEEVAALYVRPVIVAGRGDPGPEQVLGPVDAQPARAFRSALLPVRPRTAAPSTRGSGLILPTPRDNPAEVIAGMED